MAACTHQDDVVFEVNAVGWAPSGAGTALSLHREDDPARLPTAAAVGQHAHKPSGRYVLAAGRAAEDDGLCQAITPGALKPRVTYRVAGWISVAVEAAPAEGEGGHPVRVSIRVGCDDGGRVVDGGAVCAEPGRWAEIKGAFRLREEEISPRGAAVVVHVHGAPAGVDVKVMDLRILATDRKARFGHLKAKTDKVSTRAEARRGPQVRQRRGGGGVGARGAAGQLLPAGQLHQLRGDQDPVLRRLLHHPLQLGRLRERAQVVLDGGAARAAQLRRRRPPGRLLRPRRETRARPLHLLGRRRRSPAVDQGHPRRRPGPAHGRRGGPRPGPPRSLRRPVPALRRQQRDAPRPLLPRPPRRRRRAAHVPGGGAARSRRRALRQRLQRRVRQRPARHAGEVRGADPGAPARRRAGGRHRAAGPRQQPRRGGHLRRARQALRRHGPARLDHRARRPRARRGAPRRRPRGGAPGGVRAPGRGGDRVLGVHAGPHVATGRRPRQRRRHRQQRRAEVRRPPERVDHRCGRAHRRRRAVQVQGLPRHVRGARHHRDGEDAQGVHRRQRGRHARAGHGCLTIKPLVVL